MSTVLSARSSKNLARQGKYKPLLRHQHGLTQLTRAVPRYIAIGLALPTADLDSMVGWGPSTWGYHGDDGQVRNGEIPNRDYGPRFTTADVIGCYYRRMDLSIHFTKNGKYLGK